MRYQLFCYQQMVVNNCLTLVVSSIFITLALWFISLWFMLYAHCITSSLRALLYVDVARSSQVSSLALGGLVSLQLYFTYLSSHAVANHLASSSRPTICYRFIQRSTFDFVPSIKKTFVKLSLPPRKVFHNSKGKIVIKISAYVLHQMVLKC